MALQAASPMEKARKGAQPMRKYHDSGSDVKGYLLICLRLYIFFSLSLVRTLKICRHAIRDDDYRVTKQPDD